MLIGDPYNRTVVVATAAVTGAAAAGLAETEAEPTALMQSQGDISAVDLLGPVKQFPII